MAKRYLLDPNTPDAVRNIGDRQYLSRHIYKYAVVPFQIGALQVSDA